MKKFLLSALSVVTVAALAITGTIAWLQDDDSDVNVMTVGNVQIEQHEYEREVDENGDYKTKDGSYVLTDFKQGKPLLPATSLNADGTVNNFGAGGWDDTKVKMTQVNSYGTMDVFKNANAQDKFVTVENTGKTDAYVRTLIAFELGDVAAADYEKYVRNSTRSTDEADNFGQPWLKNDIGVIEVDGNNYVLVEFIYHGAELSDGSFRHENGVLPAGDTSYPSLCQVYMTAAVTNEIVDALDGNNNGTYDILVVSQAVQAAGFADAETALNAGFGDITTTNHPWAETVIASEVEITEGGTYELKDDVYTIDTGYFHTQKVTEDVTINGNGATVEGIATSIDAFQWEGGTIPAMSPIFSSADGSKVIVNDLKFTGTMSSIMLGNYVNSTYNKFDTELNNVDVIGTEVVSFSAGISPAVTVYGKAVLNNCNIYGTTLSELDTDPMWPVYDLALTNYTTTTLNNSNVGSIYMWNHANLTIDNNSEVDSIVVLNKVSNKFAITVKGGSTVGTIDLSKIDASCEDKVTITIEDGATVGAFVDNGVSYDTLDAWKAANN